MELEIDLGHAPGANLRNLLTQSQWKKCQKWARDQTGDTCAICGGVSPQPHFNTHCHEIWEYENHPEYGYGVKRLVGLVALCTDCHSFVHYFTWADNDRPRVEAHAMRVNSWTAEDLETHSKARSMETRPGRALRSWVLEVDPWLEKNLGITSPHTENLNVEDLKDWHPDKDGKHYEDWYDGRNGCSTAPLEPGMWFSDWEIEHQRLNDLDRA